jgi:BASS family bile acid:Na+ symporter
MHATLATIFRVLLGVAVPLASFANGLRAATVEPLWLARRPGLLLRSLFAILVLVPVGSVLFLEAIAAPLVVKAGLTVAIVAIGIGPPAALKRTGHDESVAFEISLDVLLLALGIVYMPAVVALHGAVFHHETRLAPGSVAGVVLTKALGPMLVGALVARMAPRLAAPIGRYAGIFVQVALLIVVAMALLVSWRSLVGLGGSAWLTCAAIALGDVVVGHALGGPARETRRVLAGFSALRFPALALLLASASPRGKSFIPVILAYVLVSAAMVALYNAVTSIRVTGGGQRRARRAAVRSPA